METTKIKYMKTNGNDTVGMGVKTTHFNNGDGSSTVQVQGLTKRELFASMAMQGILANSAESTEFSRNEIAYSSVMMADSLINELNKEVTNG